MKIINICTDPILKERLKKKGIDAQVFGEILTNEEKEKMLESLERFASNWFLTNVNVDYTEYQNVSIGAAIYDEVRMLFQLLIHFILMLDRLDLKNNIIFYHSTSCIMPDMVIEFLKCVNVKVELIDEKYPWLSFKEQYESGAKSNFSRIAFDSGKEKYFNIRSKLGQIKLSLRLLMSKISFRLLNNSKKRIYFHAHRSLIEFYSNYLSTNENPFGMVITDTTPLEPRMDKGKMNIFMDAYQLTRMARKGIMIDSLKPLFYYKWYVHYKKRESYKKLYNNFLREFPKKDGNYFNIKNKDLSEYFVQRFTIFYLTYLVQFMKIIDFYYDKFSKIKVDLCLQEMCHPFQAQVLANLGIPCRFFPSNHILHNQYFAPVFFKRIKDIVKPLAFSDLDARRFQMLGFKTENIESVDNDYLRHWTNKIKPCYKIVKLRDRKVLLLPPSIIAMQTYRYQVQGKFLYSFFDDVFEIMNEMNVLSVTIRPHPGANVWRNQFGYTDNDIYTFLVSKVDTTKKGFEIKFSDSYHSNLERDILDNDIVLGTISGAIFETIIYGRDYVYYDDTVTPFYGDKDWSIFNDGLIKRLKTKEELRDYLENYVPTDIQSLQEKLFRNTKFDSRGLFNNLNYRQL